MKIIYEDQDLLAIDKPAGISVFPETEDETIQKYLSDALIKEFDWFKSVGKPPRYGILHRLDKDTSGILLVAKNDKAFSFFQNQFLEKTIEKKYIALVAGAIKENQSRIENYLIRSPNDRRKQKVLSELEVSGIEKRARKAIAEFKVIKRFKEYTLIEVAIETGRKHQIRSQFAHLGHPVAGDKLYGFKNQKNPDELIRQFLHAGYLKIKLLNGKFKELKSDLPDDLKNVLEKLK